MVMKSLTEKLALMLLGAALFAAGFAVAIRTRRQVIVVVPQLLEDDSNGQLPISQ